MKVLVTGGTGFVGRYVVRELLRHNHDVTVITRHDSLQDDEILKNVSLITADIHQGYPDLKKTSFLPDALIHLAWDGLPNYKSLFHLETNFPADIRFLKNIVSDGVKQVLVSGTCFEYGLVNGALHADNLTSPVTAYGLAKDNLRKYLELLQQEYDFLLQWVRLFYLYGEGQKRNSLVGQLDEAIARGSGSFDMSGGEQLRDFLPVEEVAKKLVDILEQPGTKRGVMNCCSGKPISVRRFVEERIKQKKGDLSLNLGVYPYPDYEPMAFWGVDGN